MMSVRVIRFLVLIVLSISPNFADDLQPGNDTPKNVILILGRVPAKWDLEKQVGADNKSEGGSIYLGFPSKIILKGCTETNKTRSSPLSLLFHRSLDNTMSCEDCRETLRNSVNSLLSWTTNVKEINEGLVTTSNFFQADSRDVGPVYQLNRLKRNSTDNQNRESEMADDELDQLLNFREAFRKLRKGILSQLMEAFGISLPTDEETMFPDPYATNNLTAMVQHGLQQMSTSSKGYLFVIAGDDLQDPLDPIRSAASRDLDEAVRLAVENTNLADTLLVVAGLCPDGSENNTDVPIYATGPGDNFTANLKFLWQVPQSIRQLLQGGQRALSHFPEAIPLGKPTINKTQLYLFDDDKPERMPTTANNHVSLDNETATDAAGYKIGGESMRKRRSTENKPSSGNSKPTASNIKTGTVTLGSKSKADDNSEQLSKIKSDVTQQVAKNKSDDKRAQVSDIKPETTPKISENKPDYNNLKTSENKTGVTPKDSENKSNDKKPQRVSGLKSDVISNVTGNRTDGAKENVSQAKLEVTATDSGKTDTNVSSRDTSAKPPIPSAGKTTEKTMPQSIYTPGTIQTSSNPMMYSKTSQNVTKNSVKPEIRNSTNNTINAVNISLTGNQSNNVTGQETAFDAQSTFDSVRMVPSGTNNGHANKYETVKTSVEKNVKNTDVEKGATTMNKTLLNTTHDILQSSSTMNQAVWKRRQENVHGSSRTPPNKTQGSSKTNKTIQNVTREVNDNTITNSADVRALTLSACLLAGAVFRCM